LFPTRDHSVHSVAPRLHASLNQPSGVSRKNPSIGKQAAPGHDISRGKTKGGERRLSAIIFTDVVGYTSLTHKNEAVALVHTGLGEKESAIEWLEKAYEEHSGALLSIKVRPIWSTLRHEPRFVQLLNKIGLSGESPPLPRP